MKKIIVFITLLICFITTNVYAEPTTWPNTFTYGDYEYQIEGVSLRVYSIQTEESGTEVTDESHNNYINEIVTREIPLSSSEYTINPEYREENLNGANSILIDLNLNISKEQLETLLSEEIANVTETQKYLAEIALNYKITRYPNTYQHIYNINFMREFINAFYNKLPEEQNMEQTIHQVFNAAIINLNKETNTPELSYEKALTEENDLGNFVFNYLGFYENEYTRENTVPNQMILFYNIDNIDYLIENLNNVQSDIEDNAEEMQNPKTSISEEVVNTPDTAKEVPIYIYIISISCIIIGLSTMGYAIYKENHKIV